MRPQTHRGIDPRLCGEPTELRDGHCTVALTPTAAMAADDTGLVHGGFLFGLADYAAMLAVNHPNVVLGSAQVRFLKPVRVGEALVAEAMLLDRQGAKQIVTVDVGRGDEVVFRGEFVCFTPERHVLDRRSPS